MRVRYKVYGQCSKKLDLSPIREQSEATLASIVNFRDEFPPVSTPIRTIEQLLHDYEATALFSVALSLPSQDVDGLPLYSIFTGAPYTVIALANDDPLLYSLSDRELHAYIAADGALSLADSPIVIEEDRVLAGGISYAITESSRASDGMIYCVSPI